MDMTRSELMLERDKAIAERNWLRMNELTKALAALPMRGVKPLTTRDIERYAKRHHKAGQDQE
jgi:hypothetical protein